MSQQNSAYSSVEICDLIFEYAKKFPIPKEIRCKVDFTNWKPGDFDFTRLHISNRETHHSPTVEGQFNGLSVVNGPMSHSAMMKQKRNSHVLFSSVFTNQTDQPQTNHLHTERRTSATCRISMSKSVCKEGSLSLQIGPPGPVIQANGGFRREVQMSREQERVFEEELVWSIDSEVIVPPGHRTTAELVITEDEYDGTFTVKTVFSGTIILQLRDRRDGSFIYPIPISDLTRVFTTSDGFQPIPDQPGAVSYTNEGKCRCHYGIGQQVKLKQEKL